MDIVGALIEEGISTVLLPEDQQPTAEEIAAQFSERLTQAIGNSDAEMVTIDFDVQLTKKDGEWVIELTDDFMDATVGGILSMAKTVSDLADETAAP